jgi:hypothetical protein
LVAYADAPSKRMAIFMLAGRRAIDDGRRRFVAWSEE